MFTKTFVKAAVALIGANLVSAQTFTDCNPMEKSMFMLMALPSILAVY